MIEQFRIINGGTCGALLTDLSNLDLSALSLMFNKLTKRKPGAIISSTFSTNEDLIQVVSLGSIVGLVLFKLYSCNLLLFVDKVDTANFSDNNTPFLRSGWIKINLEKL